MKNILVNGAGGFIGSHMVKRLKREGHWVRGVDVNFPAFSLTAADEFVLGDLRDQQLAAKVVRDIDEVYQLAGDMSGAGCAFTAEHDAYATHNSAMINLNTLEYGRKAGIRKFFYSSCACIYPEYNQRDPENLKCSDEPPYLVVPNSDYSLETLFIERLYFAYQRDYGVEVRIAHLHNIFGPEGTWTGRRAKAPAALCRKVAETPDGGEIEVWSDARQTSSFLYIDSCIEAVRRLMDSSFPGPVNIRSEETVTISAVAEAIMDIAHKRIRIRHIPGPAALSGRNSDDNLIRQQLGWAPDRPLREGLEKTYTWVAKQVSVSEPHTGRRLGSAIAVA
ncbi:MAG: NAD-dependent epimerase/dehydratase family protein [Acidobacteria bacterium]|nr:NAD-dependent epimerase/dehydratase family protein [Acidobacteriota bacterium]